MQVFCLGHSMVYGFHDSRGGWPQRLREKLEERERYFEVYQLGVPDEDSSELLERFEGEVRARLVEEDRTVILVQTGANDTQWINGEKRVGLEEFRENIEKLAKKAQNFTEKVVFLGEPYTGLDGHVDGFEEIKMEDSEIGRYSGALEEICNERGIEFINIRERTNRDEWLENLEDGIHPSDKGHIKMFELVVGELNDWL